MHKVTVARHAGPYTVAEGRLQQWWIVGGEFCGFGYCDTSGIRVWVQVFPWLGDCKWIWRHDERVSDMAVIRRLNRQQAEMREAA